METRKYLKTAEDVLALKDTDTKIYEKGYSGGYFKFVKGTLCRFNTLNSIEYFNPSIDMEEEIYIVEEDPMQEATEKDIGKLCFAWNYGNEEKDLGILRDYYTSDDDEKYHIVSLGYYKHCRPLTKEEIKEFMEKAE